MGYGLETIGLHPAGEIYRNMGLEQLIANTVADDGGVVTSSGAVAIDTGIYTGRSPLDRFIVDEPSSSDNIWWGPVNRKVSESVFEELFAAVQSHYNSGENSRTTYIYDGHAGADPRYTLNVRIVAQKAWQAYFCRNMFINLSAEELEVHAPDFTIINASDLKNLDWERHGLHSETFILFHLKRRIAIIGGTEYGGEMKKGIFSVMNYLLPLQGIMTMHCSANVSTDGAQTALFFGLSGTGKTTLSTDHARTLIGDDEHGWSDDGIFNFEGGCYAKVINLDADGEPDIFRAIRRGALLENVVIDRKSGEVDYSDSTKTENTRVSYPLAHIPNSLHSLGSKSMAGHPQIIIFLSADAYGILPPVSKLNPLQAMYHFISGYTAKVAGTERGISEPQATFSPCFGGPFMPLKPLVYAELLRKKIEKSDAHVYLVNTGWSGGRATSGKKRIPLKATRAIIAAIMDGSIEQSKFEPDPVLGTSIPKEIAGVGDLLLRPAEAWNDKEAYRESARELAAKFNENFQRYAADHADLVEAGLTL